MFCSLWEPRNDTWSIPALTWRMTQCHFFSISGFISKITFYNPTYERKKTTRFLLAELSSKRLHSTRGCNMKNMYTLIHIYICAQHMSIYILCIYHCIKILSTASFWALPTLSCNLCSFPKHFSLHSWWKWLFFLYSHQLSLLPSWPGNMPIVLFRIYMQPGPATT